MDPPAAAAADQLSAFIQQHLNFDYGHVTNTPLPLEGRTPEDVGPSAEDSESCSSQDTMILIGGSSEAPEGGAEAASPSYVLAKAPGMRRSRVEQPAQPFNMHIDYFSGIHTCDEDEPEEVLEEANEGSPEPLAYENQYLQVQGRKPRTGAVRRDEDKDDGYDSPGGQSSETSSTESTANQKKPLKSILPKPSEREKRKKEVKRVRFETVEEEEQEEEEEEEPPPLPPPPQEKRPPTPFQSENKIPSFRAMNSKLREQREASPSREPSAPQMSSLEERLRQLTMTADDEVDTAGLSPGSVSCDRQVLYSQQTHVTVPNPRDVLFDQETGERQVIGEQPQGEQRIQQMHSAEHSASERREGRYIDRQFTKSVMLSLNHMKLSGMSNRALLHSVTPRDEPDLSSSSRTAAAAPPDSSRPRYASSADIYGMLDRQRQNPFRPEHSRTQRGTPDLRVTFQPRVSPPREMNADMQELWRSVDFGDAKYTAL